MKKNVLSLVLAATMVAGVVSLSACGSSGGTDGGSSGGNMNFKIATTGPRLRPRHLQIKLLSCPGVRLPPQFIPTPLWAASVKPLRV